MKIKNKKMYVKFHSKISFNPVKTFNFKIHFFHQDKKHYTKFCHKKTKLKSISKTFH